MDATERVDAVTESLGAPIEDGQTLAVSTVYGEVRLASVEGQGDYVDVMLAGTPENGEPHYRIVNPPTLVPDPLGSIEINGQKFRHDPIAAIATVVASLGGSQANKGRRRR